MCVVQPAHGHHQVADAQVQLRGETLLDPELLEFHLAALFDLGFPFARFGELLLHGCTGAGMLEFDLGLHRPALAEVVAEVDHGVRNVEAAVRGIVLIIYGMGIAIDVVAVEIAGQGHFTISTDGQAAAPLRGLLRGQRRARQKGPQNNQYTLVHGYTH